MTKQTDFAKMMLAANLPPMNNHLKRKRFIMAKNKTNTAAILGGTLSAIIANQMVRIDALNVERIGDSNNLRVTTKKPRSSKQLVRTFAAGTYCAAELGEGGYVVTRGDFDEIDAYDVDNIDAITTDENGVMVFTSAPDDDDGTTYEVIIDTKFAGLVIEVESEPQDGEPKKAKGDKGGKADAKAEKPAKTEAKTEKPAKAGKGEAKADAKAEKPAKAGKAEKPAKAEAKGGKGNKWKG